MYSQVVRYDDLYCIRPLSLFRVDGTKLFFRQLIEDRCSVTRIHYIKPPFRVTLFKGP